MPRKQVERAARLVWFVDGEPDYGRVGPNREAAEVTVAAVLALGRVELIDEASVMAFRMLASSVDADPTNAALWGQYRSADETIRGLGINAAEDALSGFLAGLSADVRDAEVAEP